MTQKYGEEVQQKAFYYGMMVKYVLLGDSRYGVSPWLVTPYKLSYNQKETCFNIIHSPERVIIDRCFGQLKKRFLILENGERVALDRVPKVIISCAVLHNSSKHFNDYFDFELQIDHDEEDIGNHQEEANGTKISGEEKRKQIITVFITLF